MWAAFLVPVWYVFALCTGPAYPAPYHIFMPCKHMTEYVFAAFALNNFRILPNAPMTTATCLHLCLTLNLVEALYILLELKYFCLFAWGLCLEVSHHACHDWRKWGKRKAVSIGECEVIIPSVELSSTWIVSYITWITICTGYMRYSHLLGTFSYRQASVILSTFVLPVYMSRHDLSTWGALRVIVLALYFLVGDVVHFYSTIPLSHYIY